MNFEQMKLVEPEIRRLADNAANAGRHKADWMATLLAIHERLSKLAGHGNHVAHVCVRHVPLASRQSTSHDRHLPNTGQRGVHVGDPPGRVGTFRKSGHQDGGGNSRVVGQSLFRLSGFSVRPSAVMNYGRFLVVRFSVEVRQNE